MRVNTLRKALVVAPFLISQCYNLLPFYKLAFFVVAPFLISQCYNLLPFYKLAFFVVAPFLISQCYNATHLHGVVC